MEFQHLILVQLKASHLISSYISNGPIKKFLVDGDHEKLFLLRKLAYMLESQEQDIVLRLFLKANLSFINNISANSDYERELAKSIV